MTGDDIFKVCQQYGAGRVYYAAYARLVGDHRPLRAVGLPGVVDLGEAHTIARMV